MTIYTKSTLLAFLAVSLCSNVASAQRVVGSVNDIPVPGVGEAAAYFEPATGDVYFALDESILLLGVQQAPFGFVDGTFDPSAVNTTTPLGTPQQNDATGIGFLAPFEDGAFQNFPSGVFNLGGLLPADPSIQTAADFDALYPDAEFLFAFPGTGVVNPLNLVEGTASFSLISASASAVPEPGSLSLLLLAGVGVTVRRTRRN
ncbi:PEP-CTERM sorting domain-containing protein [Mariniblastus sp.]|nr:PEP-CTERM sorting domain-containing protein [Mariniblastus sp.]